MPTGPVNIDYLPDSVYAHELRSGVPHLHFGSKLESQFRTTHLRRVRLRVRWWFTFGAALSLFYTIIQARRTGIASAAFDMEFMVVFPCALALAWLAWAPSYERYFMPAARVLVPLKGALVAFFIAPLIGIGADEELAMLTVYMFAAFFFSGLMYRDAVIAASAILVSFITTSLMLGFTHEVTFRGLLVLIVTGAMGALVYRDVERSYRRSFLESALISELVDRDGLSGLMNRRALDEHLMRVWQQAQRDRRTLAVLMIDIDHFKSYNDSHGHQAGDAALRIVAQLLKGFTRRPLDIAARYGGEEFVVILYDMPLAHVQDVAECLRQAVERTPLPEQSAASMPGVTISIGVGMVAPAIDRTPQGALQFADEALYEAKQTGRNRVVLREIGDYHKTKTGSFRVGAAVLAGNKPGRRD